MEGKSTEGSSYQPPTPPENPPPTTTRSPDTPSPSSPKDQEANPPQSQKPPQKELPQALEQSPSKDLDIPQAIKEQFNLTEEQIKALKEQGLDIFSLTAQDLADDKKRKELFKKLRAIENLSDEQKEKIEETEKILNQPDLSVDEIRKQIEAKRREIEKSSQLSEEEKKQALEVLAEMERDLEEEVPSDSEQREVRTEQLKEKAKHWVQYAGLGLGFLAFIFLWQGFMSSKQQG